MIGRFKTPALMVAFTLLMSLATGARCLSRNGSTVLSIEEIYGDIKTARDCLSTVWNIAYARLNGEELATCLRFAFHDCGTYDKEDGEGGCNGSIFYEGDPPDFIGFFANKGLDKCFVAMEEIIRKARVTCPKLTRADATALVGAVAVHKAGGPKCRMLMGRPDAHKADKQKLPGPCLDLDGLIVEFTRMGFENPIKTCVVLSGAHSIGRARLNFTACSKGPGAMTTREFVFANHYYEEIMGKRGGCKGKWCGHFPSDGALSGEGSVTRPMVEEYAMDNFKFMKDWCPEYREESLLGVKTSFNKREAGWLPKLQVSTRNNKYDEGSDYEGRSDDEGRSRKKGRSKSDSDGDSH